MQGEGGEIVAARYLVLSNGDQVDAAQRLVGNRYHCCTLTQARNGLLESLANKQVLCWPDATIQAHEHMRSFALEIVDLAKEVKYLDSSLPTGDIFTPAWIMAQDEPWNFATFKSWANGEGSGVNFIQLITDHGEAGGEQSLAGHPAPFLALPPFLDAPGSTSRLPTAQARAAESSSVPPLHDDSAPDASEFISVDALEKRINATWDAAAVKFDSVLYAGTGSPDEPPEWHQDAPESTESDFRQLTPSEAHDPYRNEPRGDFKWPEPTNFWAEIQVPEMREEWMPPALADYFSQESETRGSDRGIMAMFGLGICAGAISDSMRVRVKPDDPLWLEPARLWIGVCGNSGTMKSPSLTAVLRPLEQLEQKLMLQAAAAIDRFNMDTDVYDQQRKNYVTAKVKGEAGIVEPLRPERPCRNRLIVKNATTEALHDILADQADRGILEVHDELSSVFTGANQYKKGGSDIEERLKLWDGGRHTIDRKGSMLSIKNWSSSIVGGTQPNKIRRIVAKMGLDDDGSIQRFNFYLARQASLDMERPAHHGHKEFTDIVERLYDIQHEGDLVFSQGANAVRRQFTEWVHFERGHKWIEDSFRSHISKMSNFFPRFCVVFHAIEAASNHSAYVPPQISEDTALRVAALLRDCLYVHAKAFYSEIIEGNSDLMQNVRYLAGKILAKDFKTLTISDISHGWTKWRTFPDWIKRGILTILTDSGWLYSNDQRGYFPGKTITFNVHPNLQSLFQEIAEQERASLDMMAERKRERMAGED